MARRDLDYSAARKLLEEELACCQGALIDASETISVKDKWKDDVRTVFQSSTMSYREVLLGCLVAKVVNPEINVTLPYRNLGERAFNGRTLDEKVINPFLRDHHIPCSKGPFLAVFRRSVKLDTETRKGMRDKSGYDALLTLLHDIEDAPGEDVRKLLRYVVYSFLELREREQVELLQPRRLTLGEWQQLLAGLLERPSGGRFPLFLAVAALRALSNYFGESWDIQHQAINVADSAAGVPGDIVIRKGQRIVLAIEVTERPVDAARIQQILQSKVYHYSVPDYVFLVKKTTDAAEEALDLAAKSAIRGHEVGFIEIRPWLISVLATIGFYGRELFYKEFVNLLSKDDIPVTVKLAWNEEVNRLVRYDTSG